jgi:hypothetical protein
VRSAEGWEIGIPEVIAAQDLMAERDLPLRNELKEMIALWLHRGPDVEYGITKVYR